MTSGPKKRRAQKNKKEVAAAAAAAVREISENEATLTVSSKEKSPVVQTESTEGVAAVFDKPTVVLPKRTVLLESMLASEVLDSKRKDPEEGIEQNVVAAENYSSAQSSNDAEVAQHKETSHVDVVNVIGESSDAVAAPSPDAVAAPCVIELDSEEEDGGSMMFSDVCDSKGRQIDGTVEIFVPTKIDSSVLVSEPRVSTLADETDAVYAYATELLQDGDEGFIMASDDAAFSVKKDDARIPVTTTACDNYMDTVDSDLEKEQILVTLKNKVGVENNDTAALDDEDAPEYAEEALQVGEVEAAGKYHEAAILEGVNNTEKSPFEVVAENKIADASNEVDAPEVIGEAGRVDGVKADMKNQEAANSEDVNDTEQLKIIPSNIDVVGANAAMDIIYQTEVRKQLKETKELLEDVLKEVLNRLSAIDSLLGRN